MGFSTAGAGGNEQAVVKKRAYFFDAPLDHPSIALLSLVFRSDPPKKARRHGTPRVSQERHPFHRNTQSWHVVWRSSVLFAKRDAAEFVLGAPWRVVHLVIRPRDSTG